MVQQRYFGENASLTETYKCPPESPLCVEHSVIKKDIGDFYLGLIRPSRPAEHTPSPPLPTKNCFLPCFPVLSPFSV